MVLRKMALAASPTVYLLKKGDDYEFHTVSTFKSSVIKFRLNEEFDEERLDGVHVKSVMTLEGNTLTQTQKTDKPTVAVRVFSETELIVYMDYGGLKSTRWYKVVT